MFTPDIRLYYPADSTSNYAYDVHDARVIN